MKNDELRLGLINSSDLIGRLDEIVILFRHRFVVFVLCAPVPVLVLAANRRDGLPRWLDGATYAAGVVALLAALHLLAVALRHLFRRPEVLHVPFLLLNIPAVAVAIATVEGLAVFAGASPRPLPDLAAAGFLIVVLLEAGMSLAGRTFLLAALAARRNGGGMGRRPAQKPVAASPAVVALSDLPPSVRIGGRDIALTDLSHISGEGSRVTVYFGSRSLQLSARFANIMASLPDAAGMQINRTVWVSAPQAVRSRLERAGRETVLQLPDGTVLEVAPNRRAELAAWIRALQGN